VIFTLKPDKTTPLHTFITDLANPFLYISFLIALFIFPPKEDKESEDSDDSIDLKTENIAFFITHFPNSPPLKTTHRRKTEVVRQSIVNKTFPPIATMFTIPFITFAE